MSLRERIEAEVERLIPESHWAVVKSVALWAAREALEGAAKRLDDLDNIAERRGRYPERRAGEIRALARELGGDGDL